LRLNAQWQAVCFVILQQKKFFFTFFIICQKNIINFAAHSVKSMLIMLNK